MKINFKFYWFPFIILTILGIINCGCRNSNNINSNSSYEDSKMNLIEKEKQNPTLFLKTDGTFRKNLIGEWVLEGTIINSATIATYKDVEININYYSKTNTFLGTESKIIYDFFPAGQTKSFKIKTFGYEATKTIGWDILSATPVN